MTVPEALNHQCCPKGARKNTENTKKRTVVSPLVFLVFLVSWWF